MDSISPLNLDHDHFPENENSMLKAGNQMKNEPVSENLSPLTPVDKKLQKCETECMPISHLEFKDDIFPDRENSVLAPGKYEAISPVKQEDLFSDKENVTPASKVKPSVRRVLGSRMDNSVSGCQQRILQIRRQQSPKNSIWWIMMFSIIQIRRI